MNGSHMTGTSRTYSTRGRATIMLLVTHFTFPNWK